MSIPWPNTDGLPDLGGDRVVVVHRVEVARGARVADEVRAGQVLDDERRRLVADVESVEGWVRVAVMTPESIASRRGR